MAEEKVAPNWKNPAIWSAVLLAAIIIETPVVSKLGNQTANMVGALWDIADLALAMITCAAWNTQIKRVETLPPPKGEIWRSSIPFFITSVLLGLACGASFFVFGEFPWQRMNIIVVYVFIYLTILLLVRGVLAGIVKIVSGKREKLPHRLATGFADGFLILVHGVALYLRAGTIRLIILVVVLTGVRVGWGYVPEERLEIVREFFVFLKERKLWWMTPIFVILALLAVVVVLTESTGGAFPFIYAVF